MRSTSRAWSAFFAACAVTAVVGSADAQPAPSASTSPEPPPNTQPTQTQPADTTQPSQPLPQPSQPGQPVPGQPAPGQYPAQEPYPQGQYPAQGQYPQGQYPPGQGQANPWGGYPNAGYDPNGPPPGYGPQRPYYSQYGGPPQGPPPLPPQQDHQFRFAVRFDPFDLIFRRLSFQAELVLWGPFSIEAEPSWIFASATENLDTTGGALNGNFLVYFTGDALKGFFVKATVGFEKFDATVTDSALHQAAEDSISSPLIGVGIGSSTVFGDDYGFNLAGGIGIGYLTADTKTLTAGRYEASFYDKSSAIQLMASLGLGFSL